MFQYAWRRAQEYPTELEVYRTNRLREGLENEIRVFVYDIPGFPESHWEASKRLVEESERLVEVCPVLPVPELLAPQGLSGNMSGSQVNLWLESSSQGWPRGIHYGRPGSGTKGHSVGAGGSAQGAPARGFTDSIKSVAWKLVEGAARLVSPRGAAGGPSKVPPSSPKKQHFSSGDMGPSKRRPEVVFSSPPDPNPPMFPWRGGGANFHRPLAGTRAPSHTLSLIQNIPPTSLFRPCTPTRSLPPFTDPPTLSGTMPNFENKSVSESIVELGGSAQGLPGPCTELRGYQPDSLDNNFGTSVLTPAADLRIERTTLPTREEPDESRHALDARTIPLTGPSRFHPVFDSSPPRPTGPSPSRPVKAADPREACTVDRLGPEAALHRLGAESVVSSRQEATRASYAAEEAFLKVQIRIEEEQDRLVLEKQKQDLDLKRKDLEVRIRIEEEQDRIVLERQKQDLNLKRKERELRLKQFQAQAALDGEKARLSDENSVGRGGTPGSHRKRFVENWVVQNASREFHDQREQTFPKTVPRKDPPPPGECLPSHPMTLHSLVGDGLPGPTMVPLKNALPRGVPPAPTKSVLRGNQQLLPPHLLEDVPTLRPYGGGGGEVGGSSERLPTRPAYSRRAPEQSFEGENPIFQPQPYGGGASVSQLVGPNYVNSQTQASEATNRLIEVQAQNNAFQMLAQRRPKEKFSGDTKRVDFETYLRKFEVMTDLPGATDVMKLMELEHWFTGKAGLVVNRFLTARDPCKGLEEAKGALKLNFGLRRFTAKQLLDDLIMGERFPEREHEGIQTFIKLERVYQQAVETGRSSTFNAQEIFEEILRVKLPHLAGKWAKKRSDVEAFGRSVDEVWDFPKFVEFLRQQNRTAEICSEVTKSKATGVSKAAPPRSLLSVHSAQVESVPKVDSKIPANQPVCVFCQGAHPIERCRNFLSRNPEERAQICMVRRLCFRCLGSNHRARECGVKSTCSHCGGANHHDALHRPNIQRAPETAS